MSAARRQADIPISGKARASFALSLLSFFIVPGLAAIVLGHMGRRYVRESGGKIRGAGLALAGLVFGYGGTLAGALFFTFGFLMLQGDIRAGTQGAAVDSLIKLNKALESYASTYNQGYPFDLQALGPPAPGAENNAKAAGLIDQALASGDKHRYHFTYTPTHFNGQGFADEYTLQADCTTASLRAYHYYVDQTGVIRVEAGHSADANSRSLK